MTGLETLPARAGYTRPELHAGFVVGALAGDTERRLVLGDAILDAITE